MRHIQVRQITKGWAHTHSLLLSGSRGSSHLGDYELAVRIVLSEYLWDLDL